MKTLFLVQLVLVTFVRNSSSLLLQKSHFISAGNSFVLNNHNSDNEIIHETKNLETKGSQSPSHFYSKKSFGDLGLSSALNDVVNHLQLTKPSKVQALSFNEIYTGKSCILADQTGSGKTLAYILPTIQRMYENRNKKISVNTTTSSDWKGQLVSPEILIIAPTNELANQVWKVLKSISSVLRFRSACITSGNDGDAEIKKLKLGADIVVCTPGRLFSLLKQGDFTLKDTKSIILDEADVLFLDESFPLQGIGEYCPSDSQYVFVTATLPEVTMRQILKEFPESVLLKGPGLHRIPPTVEETLIDCSNGPGSRYTGGGSSGSQRIPFRNNRNNQPTAVADAETIFENKRLGLMNALALNDHVERSLIFCNTIEQCRRVENALLRADKNGRVRQVLSYHSAIDVTKRKENMLDFTRKLLPLPAVLICTDRASRGIDFDNINVDHVILFDFPQEPSEYVRRVGRTGRAGRFGKVTVLAYGRQVAMVNSLLMASKEGKRIDPIPSLNTFKSWSKEE